MANITIDGKPFTVKDGITVIEAIDNAGIALPRYCYHPGLSIAGNCRICQVEITGMPRTQIACNTRVTEGMAIQTDSAKAKESQQTVLEFILANHPLDCPVCDQAGECKLQDYYMEYGAYDPKFNENKVKKTKKAAPVGPTIMLDQERCILCSRCVRFTDEITHTHEFGIFNRGDHAQVDVHHELKNKYSGNVADICPVGALTDRDFRFKARVWYLAKQKSVCPGCSRGCNISVEFEHSRPYPLKKARVMRLKPVENPEVNRWWMCDDGRYAYKSIDEGRLESALQRGASGAEARTRKEALAAVSTLLPSSKQSPKWGLIASPQMTNEELYLLKALFVDQLGWKQAAFSWKLDRGSEDAFLIQADKNPNSSGAAEIFGEDGGIEALVEAARKGAFEGLFVVERDLSRLGPEVLKELRKSVKYLIYDGAHRNATAETADWTLPSAVYAEKDGTFVNFEGRVQRIRKAVEPIGEAAPLWLTLVDLARALGLNWNYKKPEEIFKDLASKVPAFAGMSYAGLEPHGCLWKGLSVSPKTAEALTAK